MSTERVYLYWDRPGPPPAPGEHITLEDGSHGVVDTAHASAGTLERRKLTVLIEHRKHHEQHDQRIDHIDLAIRRTWSSFPPDGIITDDAILAPPHDGRPLRVTRGDR